MGSFGRLEGSGKNRHRVGLRWRDLDLEAATFRTDPAWAKSGRVEVRPLYGPLVAKLKDWKASLGAGPDDWVFPVLAPRATFRMDREAAGIRERDVMGMPFTIHGLRQSFSVWLDAAGVSAGARSALLCHADTLAEQRYTHIELEKLRDELAKLPDPWPDGMNVVPPDRGGKPSGNGGGTKKSVKKSAEDSCQLEKIADDVSVTQANSSILQHLAPVSLDPACVTTSWPERPEPSAAQSGPAVADVRSANAHCRMVLESGTNALDAAVMALAQYVSSRSGSPKEPADVRAAQQPQPHPA